MHEPATELIRRGFVNLTPFSAGHFLLLDARGTEVLTLAVKASFLLTPPARLTPLEPQLPIHMEPVFHGKTGASSLKYELDAVLPKLTTDVVLLGHAHAPAPRTTQVEVSLRVGALSKQVLVLGDRAWASSRRTDSPASSSRGPMTPPGSSSASPWRRGTSIPATTMPRLRTSSPQLSWWETSRWNCAMSRPGAR